MEDYYECEPAPPDSNPSSCYYIGDVTLTLDRVEKTGTSNRATFYLTISPFVPLMSQLDEENTENNMSNWTTDRVYVNDDNKLVV